MSGPSIVVARTALLLQATLQDLDQAISNRQVIQKRATASSAHLTLRLKMLERRWDRQDYGKLLKLQSKHNVLLQRLAKADQSCIKAREAYQHSRERDAAARNDQTAIDVAAHAAQKQMYQRQGAMTRTLTAVFATLLADTSKGQYQVRKGAYDYIPLDIPSFLGLLIDIDRLLSNDADYVDATKRYRPVSFLEVGAGSGRNLVLARSSQLVLFRDVSGFDINPDLIQTGQRALGLQNSLQVGDALTFDYAPYDVLYSYRPMQDSDMQAKLESYMARSMRMNAYLLAPTAHDLSLCPELTPIAGAANIWKKTQHFSPDISDSGAATY